MKRIFIFLGWVLFLTLISSFIILLLEDYSIYYNETGNITFGYIVYACVGVFIETPTPFLAAFITRKKLDKISFKEFIKDIFKMNRRPVSFIVFILFILLFTSYVLIKNGGFSNNWYMVLVSFPLLIIGGGIEEVGWRGFLQKELEEKTSFLISTSIVSSIWFVWHLPLWLQPSSNHYNDSIIGFFLMIFMWSFVLATIYKATKSTFLCVCFHAFINSFGAVFDWNNLFDNYPKNNYEIIFFISIVIISIIIYYVIDKKEKNSRLLEN